MRPLRFSINVTLDGCHDHTVGIPDEDLHRNAAEFIAQSDVMLLGRVTYKMMEDAWRMPPSGIWPDWMPLWMQPFAKTMDAAKKHVVSGTLKEVDWNSELVRGDLATFVQQLKQQPGKPILQNAFLALITALCSSRNSTASGIPSQVRRIDALEQVGFKGFELGYSLRTTINRCFGDIPLITAHRVA